MKIVKGIFKGNAIKLLEPIKAKYGVEVEVIFREPDKKTASFNKAMKEELERMDKGLQLGCGQYYQSRDELHETFVNPFKSNKL